ncbi:MAG: hypothetical protein ACLGI3_17075, partial [Actinomycetes bacterium]
MTGSVADDGRALRVGFTSETDAAFRLDLDPVGSDISAYPLLREAEERTTAVEAGQNRGGAGRLVVILRTSGLVPGRAQRHGRTKDLREEKRPPQSVRGCQLAAQRPPEAG